MSTYIISDIHGHYTEFEKMLKKIQFTDNDTMYILGDIIDRGTENVKMIEYVMTHENVHMILGNHEDFLIKAYTAKNALERKYAEALWIYNGGDTTKKELEELPEETRTRYVDFIKSLPQYLFIQNGEILLVHAGIALKKNKTTEELMENQGDNFIWIREEFFNSPIDAPFTIIFGHTPTVVLPRYCYDLPKEAITNADYAHIVKWKNRIDLDCGCAYGEKLGCLKLDGMQEFYVKCEEL